MTNFTSLQSFTQSSIISSLCQLWKLQGACISFASWFALSGWTVELNSICEPLSQKNMFKQNMFEHLKSRPPPPRSEALPATQKHTTQPAQASPVPWPLFALSAVSDEKIEGQVITLKHETRAYSLFSTSFHPPSFCCLTCRTWAASAPLDEACVDLSASCRDKAFTCILKQHN